MSASIDYDAVELEKTKELVISMLDAHWTRIQGALIRSEDQMASVGINVKLDHSGIERDVKVKIGYAVKTTDEAETTVHDPRQEELPI